MNASTDLPQGYHLRGTLDLSRNKKAFLAVNAFGFILLLFFTWLFIRLAAALRQSSAIPLAFPEIRGLPGGQLVTILLLFVLLGIMLVLHEAIHGFFFWLFTRQRPRFGFRGVYAFAAAPDWYLPRWQYAIVGISPLVVISLLGLLLIPVVPEVWLMPVLTFMIFNASGAAGDVIVVAWLLLQPPGVLARDAGDAVSLYGPGIN
jgi:hypothetical protein